MDPTWSTRLSKAFDITPSDTVPLNSGHGTKAVLALTDGNVDVLFQEDQPSAKITLPVVAGTLYPFNLRFVYTTSVATLAGFL